MTLQNNYLLIVVSAILTGISQHPLNLGFLCWFSLIPLLKVLNEQKTFKAILKFSFLWGFLYHIIAVFWLAFNIGTTPLIAFISMIITVLILSFNTILIGGIWYKIKSKYSNLYIFAIVWVSIEYVRSYGLLGFPWISLANSQTDYIYLIQNVQFTGIYGITFWIVLLNIFLFNIKSYLSNRRLLISFGLIILTPWIIGFALYHNIKLENNQNNLSLLVVQPNINLFDKRDIQNKNKVLDDIISTTKTHVNQNHDLVIWPESAMPNHLMQNRVDRKYLSQKLFQYDNQYLLTGNVYFEKQKIYNSVILLNQQGIKETYHKRQLVPLAEHFPFSENFNFLKNINIGQANFSKGKKDVIFNLKDYSFASLVCFESTFPEINRRHANENIDLLIYLVNDGWYTTPPQPQQHAKQSIFRAIENRVPVVRCANTGISIFINARGDIEKSIELNKLGTLDVSINKNIYGKTFYTRFGNVFALILLIVTMVLLIKSLRINENK